MDQGDNKPDNSLAATKHCSHVTIFFTETLFSTISDSLTEHNETIFSQDMELTLSIRYFTHFSLKIVKPLRERLNCTKIIVSVTSIITINERKMKRIIYFKSVFVLAGIYIFFSCNLQEYHQITISIDNTCNFEQQSAAYEVINKRIASVCYIKEKTDLLDGKFDLTYSGKDSLLTQILTKKGEIYITEMYLNNEIQSSLDKIYERLFWFKENTDSELSWGVDNRTLINVPRQQIACIDSIFNSYKHLLPADISFAWTAIPNNRVIEGESFALLALKSTQRAFPLNPNTVKNSDVMNCDYAYSHQKLYIEFNKQYREEWAKLTRDNISRRLAIVMDGKVLMHPTVQSEITGGRLEIIGDFDNSELLLIKSVILGGVLDCKAQIINR